MLKTKMYVRCPADQESMYEPRIFVCGQIINIDEFKRTVSVKVHDPFGHLLFFEDLPKGVIELPLGSVDRCSFFIGSIVVYKGSSYKVLSCQKCKDDYYKYYIQNFDDTSVVKVPEADVIAAFNNGQVDPCVQLKNYEFQNPAWYLGRAVVAKSMDILENSIYGFKELAGSKIYLMPHQVNTIMRCLQESPCRYMLADEVGMGKTIEAISVYKIYTMNQSNKKALIVVPQVLKEQWISELLLKFNIPNGMGKNNNSVTVKTLQELSEKDLFSVMSQKSADVNNQQTVRRYFNIGQGGASTNVVLDAIALSKVFGKVKKSRLIIEPEEKQNDDRIKQRRDAYTFLNDIEERIESVAKSELENGKAKLQRIYDAFGDNEIGEDELTEFISRVKKFYEEANKAQVNVKEISLDGIKKVSILEKAISDIAAVLDEDDPLTIIMAFSGDPVTTINRLINVIDALETEIAKAKTIIANKKAALGPDGEDSADNNRYSAELVSINQSRQKIEGMVKV